MGKNSKLKLAQFIICITIPAQANSTETQVELDGSLYGLFRVVWTDGTKTLSQSLLIH